MQETNGNEQKWSRRGFKRHEKQSLVLRTTLQRHFQKLRTWVVTSIRKLKKKKNIIQVKSGGIMREKEEEGGGAVDD